MTPTFFKVLSVLPNLIIGLRFSPWRRKEIELVELHGETPKPDGDWGERVRIPEDEEEETLTRSSEKVTF